MTRLRRTRRLLSGAGSGKGGGSRRLFEVAGTGGGRGRREEGGELTVDYLKAEEDRKPELREGSAIGFQAIPGRYAEWPLQRCLNWKWEGKQMGSREEDRGRGVAVATCIFPQFPSCVSGSREQVSFPSRGRQGSLGSKPRLAVRGKRWGSWTWVVRPITQYGTRTKGRVY